MKFRMILSALLGIFSLSFALQRGGLDATWAGCIAIGSVALVAYLKFYHPNLFPDRGYSTSDYVGVGRPGGPAGIQVITSERDRASYVHNKTNPKYEGKDLAPGYLRLESVIKNNSGKLIFKTFEGDGATVYPTERRLDKNDSFIATEASFYLLKQDVTNSKTNGKPLTYPNVQVFGAAAADFLWAIYNSGELKVTIGKKVWIPGLDVRRFLSVPQTQQSAPGNLDQYSSEMGRIMLTPQLEIDGSGSNEIEINFTGYAGWAGGTSADVGFEHRAVLYFSGLLVTGGSANT